MFRLVMRMVLLLLVLGPWVAAADAPDEAAVETPVAMPIEISEQGETPRSGSRVHPYGLSAEGWLGPTFEGPWRFRIALNGWLPNEILVTVDTGDSRETVEEDLGWLITNMEYYFPVDFEVRKGPFGVYVHGFFFKVDGAQHVIGDLELNWDDTISLIDAGLSYELGRWPLTGDPAGPAVTVEPFVGARIMRDPLTIDLGRLGAAGDLSSTVPTVGLRTHWDLTEHWNLRVEGDYGGFGVDDNHQTWQAVGLIGYRLPGFGAHWNLQVG